MPALSQLFLQALLPRIVHYGRCLYTWACPILVEAGVELLARGQVLVGDWTTRQVPLSFLFGVIDVF
jgi:hypothetical protein